MTFITENPLIFVLLVSVAILAIMLIRLSMEMQALKKKYLIFMGSERKPGTTLESLLMDYATDVKRLKEKYRSMYRKIREVEDNMGYCIRKTGIIRYNPFDEMGGNLSFAVALLNEKDDGVVLNGIHGRNGSFTYAKPVEGGKSKYILSQEEEAAIREAKESVVGNPLGKIKIQRIEKVYHVKKIIKKTEPFEQISLETMEAMEEKMPEVNNEKPAEENNSERQQTDNNVENK